MTISGGLITALSDFFIRTTLETDHEEIWDKFKNMGKFGSRFEEQVKVKTRYYKYIYTFEYLPLHNIALNISGAISFLGTLLFLLGFVTLMLCFTL